MTYEPDDSRRSTRTSKVIWSLVCVAIIAVLVAILLPPVRWALSGTIVWPVRVVLSDAESGRPISGAEIAIVHFAPSLPMQKIEKGSAMELRHQLPDDRKFLTGLDGSVEILHEFRTGASYKSPEPRAHLRSEWIVVSAAGYAGVVVPVLQESISTRDLRDLGELRVPIGLLRGK